MAISQDGLIADKNGGVDWLPHPKEDSELEAFGYKDLMSRIDSILMGSKSYKQVIGFGDWEWPDKQTYVFTSKPIKSERSYITMTQDSPVSFVSHLKEHKSKKDIWLLGGASLAYSFSKEGLIDEIVLTIVRQTLGEGIPLRLHLDKFKLLTAKLLTEGMVQKIFLRKEFYAGNTQKSKHG